MTAAGNTGKTAGVPGRRGALVVLGLVAAGIVWKRLESLGPKGDKPPSGFWERSFLTPDGATLALADLRGQPLLLNFWASWCPPCINELPLLNRFYSKNKANGWQLLGLALEKPAATQRFLARSPVSYPVGMAESGGVDLMRELGNSSGGIPFSVLFGADGRRLDYRIGELDADDLADWRERMKQAAPTSV